jgi:hypothetical protein
MTTFRTLTAWQRVVKANGANTKLVTRTKSENYYQAIRDGHIIGFFNDSTVPAGKSSGEFDVRVFDAASSPRERSLPLLVCGVVARAAYEACGYTHDGPVVFMLHPAARTWSKKSLAAITRRIATLSR